MRKRRSRDGNKPLAEVQEVIGYHGTNRECAESILKQGFRQSRNEYDWLGDGVYFWQEAPSRAWDWAVKLHREQAAVVVSRIRLADCMDLVDGIQWSGVLADAYNSLIAIFKQANLPIPQQRGKAHRLDREVINYAIGALSERGITIRTVRGVFREGHPIFPDSALFDLSHIQIAVRDTSLIQESWLDTRR